MPQAVEDAARKVAETERVEYAYDAAGRRTGRRVSIAATFGDPLTVTEESITQYDGTSRLAEFDANGQIVRHYLNGPGPNEVLAVDQSVAGSTATAWAFTDQLGSVTTWGRYDGGTWTLEHVAFDAFGNRDAGLSSAPLTVGGQLLPQLWAGHQFESELDLYHMQARWYDPQSGRFLSPDPLSYAAGDGNLYRYVGNKVTTFVDPQGLNPNQLGAKDGGEVVTIVRNIEENYQRENNGVLPTWRTTLDLFNDEMKRPIDAGSNQYYVFSKRDNRWIDMRHFNNLARITGRYVGVEPAEGLGIYCELYQWGVAIFDRRPGPRAAPGTRVAGSGSSELGVEDLYSNALGARFGSRLLAQAWEGTPPRVSAELAKEFQRLGVEKKSNAKSLPYLPAKELVWQAWHQWPEKFRHYDFSTMEGAYIGVPHPLSGGGGSIIQAAPGNKNIWNSQMSTAESGLSRETPDSLEDLANAAAFTSFYAPASHGQTGRSEVLQLSNRGR